MPTGYTAGIADGSVTDFETFAMTCARAFGATVTMKEQPLDKPIPSEFTPSTYAQDQLAKALETRLVLANLQPEQVAHEAQQHFVEAMRNWEQLQVETNETRHRYLAMQQQVASWEPPSPDHEALKAFMANQLSISIGDEVNYRQRPAELTPEQWLASKVQSNEADIAYYEKKAAEEKVRYEKANAWVRALRYSLKKAAK